MKENIVLQHLKETHNKIGIRKWIKWKIKFLNKIGFHGHTGIDPITHVSMILMENWITALDF